MIPVADTATELSTIEEERTIVTSALPYIHGVPHLGNIVGSILPADMYHRFLDLRGHENIFICGSDEHGTPLELSAIEAGEAFKEHADKQHEDVKAVLDRFNMDFSQYGRTHTAHNEDQTHQIFTHLYENDYIVEREQELPYCLVDERFLADRYIEGECPHCGGLARGDQCDDCGRLLEPEEIIDPYCTICGESDIAFRTTRNLFLQLPKFEQNLKDWLEADAPLPETKKKEVLNLIDDGLEERCITRDTDWGFSVPYEELGLAEEYADKVLYVWFDAPIGYIGITRQYFEQGDVEHSLLDRDDRSSSGDADALWRRYWQDPAARTVYSIGKDNTIFHSIIFPSMLMGGAGQGEKYNLPDHIFIHEYLLSDDVQFSKSRGTGLSSQDALDLLPADYWRFYLARNVPENHDTTFSWEDFERKINSELNDTVGNFVNRVLSLTEKWFNGRVPEPDNAERYNDTLIHLQELITEYDEAFEQEKSPKKAVEKALEIGRLGDEFISQEEPWHNEDAQDDVIYVCMQIVQAIAVTLYPFTPNASKQLWEMLGQTDDIVHGGDRLQELADGEELAPDHALGTREILFEKVDADELEAAVTGQDEDDTDTADGESGDTMREDTISFEDFQAMDLRTGTVQSVEEHPNADKLYLVQIDVGSTVKQSCAGLRPHFEPAELEGKQVIVVNNLEPTELRGETSECMMLAVDTEDDDVVLLTTEEEVANGLKVR